MKLSWLLMLVIFSHELCLNEIKAQTSARPRVVNIGALLSFKTTIGKVAKVAIEAAIEDVNSDPATLGGTKLNLAMQDSNHSGFLALAEGTSLVTFLVFFA